MRSEVLRLAATLACIAGIATGAGASAWAQAARAAWRFFPDDPLPRDDDAALDASGVKELELSEYYDFLQKTFVPPGDRSPIRAVNVNTVDEVPDSSWFTNRIGVRDLSVGEIVRGPGKFERLEATDWIVVRGKSPGGFQPGFRAEHAGDRGQVYQLELDPVAHPQMATGAELIGTLVYHALGYFVEDVYLVRVDPARITISEKATIRDASGQRRFTRRDLEAILRQGARDREGRVYMSATRFHEGEDVGGFEYYGTRTDDPNDIHPHEHRRELRANRVFCAWLAHDDSRAINTLALLVAAGGRKHVRHYMYDFGAILGSATRFAEPATNNHESFLEKKTGLVALATFGLARPRYLRVDRAAGPPSAGAVDSTSFDPERWKPNYPNPAFANMRPDDAFWGARLVARFSDEAIRAIVEQVQFDDRTTAEHITRVLIERRNAIARVWLNGVNPIVDPRLAADGTLTFANAAVAARVATPAHGYTVGWSRYDNRSGEAVVVGGESEVTEPRAPAPASLLSADFVVATIRAHHSDHPAWAQPVQVDFRRTDTGWKTVGLFRQPGHGG
jgi:hypothetical protein